MLNSATILIDSSSWVEQRETIREEIMQTILEELSITSALPIFS